MRLKGFFFLNLIFLFLFFVSDSISEDSQHKFIPAYQSFDFVSGEIVDNDKGDIYITAYGIEVVNSKVDIAQLEKGFLEDVKTLPKEELIEWTTYAEFIRDMIYTVRCTNERYVIFELINIKVSDDKVLGIEIDYKYQPDGSRNFP